MSLCYTATAGRGLWLGLAISLGLHGALAASALRRDVATQTDSTSLRGRELIDLAEVEMLLAAPETELVEGAAASDSTAALDNPEVTELAKASNDPLLAQIPYKVDDPELNFRIANPDQAVDSSEYATEVPTELKEEPKDKSALDSTAAAPLPSAGQDEASQSAETEQGLSDQDSAHVTAWQKQLVLALAGAKTYPKAARKARAEGEVVVAFTLDRYGRVQARKVAKSSGYPALDKAALAVVDGFDRLPAPPAVLGTGPFDLTIPFNYRFK
jgi:protein TonB